MTVRDGVEYPNVKYDKWTPDDVIARMEQVIEMLDAISRTRAGNHCAGGGELTMLEALRELNGEVFRLACAGKQDEGEALRVRVAAISRKIPALALHDEILGGS